jgi:hypothetical protein
VLLKQRSIVPRQLVDFGGLAEVSGISRDNGALAIGARTTQRGVTDAKESLQAFPAMCQGANLSIGISQPSHDRTYSVPLQHFSPAGSSRLTRFCNVLVPVIVTSACDHAYDHRGWGSRAGEEHPMLFLKIARAKPGFTPEERLARRMEYLYPEGVKVLGEYWTPTDDPAVITVLEADDTSQFFQMYQVWSKYFDLTIVPAVTAEEGLKRAQEMLTTVTA